MNLPASFEVEVLGQYGHLMVVMPAPGLLSAAKLARCESRDIEDVAWWIKERALSMEDIRAAIATLPNASQREAASENILLAELIVVRDHK